ncbi:SNF2 family N-terminal domain-containing protein [Mycena galopus ATCC 62051]|nr:SNF2 family N-terminal domain-containing protein [Mycena galopus ATCC 62051]
MRETTSQHSESIRALPRQHFPRLPTYNPDDYSYRPALNISELDSLLEIPISNASDASEPIGKGKKRAATPLTAEKQKRVKTSSSAGNETQKSAWIEMEYPELHDVRFEGAVPAESITVLSHTFEMRFNNSIPQGHPPKHFATAKSHKDWVLDEQNLENRLALLCGSREFDLGAICLGEYRERLVVVSEVLKKRNDNAQWLLLLPKLLDGLNFESLGITTERFTRPDHDILMACRDLQKAGRVAIKGHVTLVMLPEEDAEHFPFSLRVQLTVSLTPPMFEPIPKLKLENPQRRLLQFLYPDPALLPDSETVTNIPFFYSILSPAPHVQHTAIDRAMQPEALLPTLLPFQRRSVAWLIDREGKTVTPNGEIVEKSADSEYFSFWERIEERSNVFFIHRVTGEVALTCPDEPPPPGAILAEEPGLGKTLEIISLLLLNPAPAARNPGIKRWDPEAGVEVKAVKTTLIVTPPSLATQWIDELKLHAPSLKVLVYEGWTKVVVPLTASDIEKERARRVQAASKAKKAKTKGKGKGKKTKNGKGKKKTDSEDEDIDLDEDEDDEDVGEILDWCSYVHSFDVVITTYQTLKTDLNVARAPPKRPRREDVVYTTVERPRSPLILVEWNRVVMDEVQMVGGGNVEDMVSLIPRFASFAVSGTPARTQISDLMHVLRFLRINDVVGTQSRHWARLAIPGFSNHFSAFFQTIAIRTTKASVTNELTIPQQTRFLVSIEMGPVERHVYDQNFESILLELGLDARGVDVRGEENKEIDGALLRSSLRKLRAICTHPQIGQIGNKLFKPGALKSMEQVLQAMCDENWMSVLDDLKSKAQHGGADKSRHQRCLETLLLAEKEAKQLIEEIESTLATHEANKNLPDAQEMETDPIPSPDTKGKGKERERSLSPLSDIESNESDDDNAQTPAVKEHRSKREALKKRRREANLVMHRVQFLLGDAYHMLGASQSAAEDAAYAEAEKIRRDILKTSETQAIDSMGLLARDVTSKGLMGEELQIDPTFLDYQFEDLQKAAQKDIAESVACQEEANEIIENVLNEQAALLWEWRGRLTELLTQPLTPGEEADGQEYQRTLDDQGEAETYLVNYASLLADRREALLKERTLLATHDAREKKLRHTKAAIKAAAALDTPPMERVDHIELQPEHQVLHLELSAKRKGLVADLEGKAIKTIVVDMTNKAARIHKEDDPHKAMLKAAIADLRQLITEQGTVLDKLDADLALYRKAFNQRILYFRQLQEISDAVADVEFEGTAADALQECVMGQRDLGAKINTNRARQRYLDHLSKNKASGERDEDDETCILCKCEFIRGFITHCAHVFCEECMKAWVAKKQGNTCPVCRVAIDPQKLERFIVADQPAPPKPQGEPEPVPKSRRKINYNMIDPKIFGEIQAIPSFGDYGNKIQTLVRHLSYIRESDPGAKIIVFSAWADSLFIVERALQENGILCLRIDQKSKGIPAVKQFASSEDINVLLLHGERENAGLNITCASRVFLLESVVHHGFEIQAIARIDRMGQKRPTEVYCYYAEDTIEKNILDLAARQGTSLYTKNNSVGSIMNALSLTGDGEKKFIDSPVKKMQKGDFIFKVEDMLQILFPHLFEDIEYLIPSEEEDGDVVMEDAQAATFPANAVAGPSRLS